MNKNLPLYEALINDLEDGIFAVSLVSAPATESNWQCFSKEEQMYSIENEEEHIITGVIMLANTPIYRIYDGYEYNIVYKPETIKLMSEKMLKDMVHNQIDIEHEGNILPAGTVNLVEIYIKDSEKGISPNFLKDIPDGSLIGSYKIHDDVLWNMCKEGTLHGFSLAGWFDVKEFKDKKKSKYSMIEKIKEKLSQLLVELSETEEEEVTETVQETETVEEKETPAESTEETAETVEETETPSVAEETTEQVTETEVQMAAENEEEVPAPDETTEEVPVDGETKEEVPTEKEDNSELALIKADIVSMKNDIELAKGLYEQMKTDLESIKETLQNLVNAPVVPPVTEQFEAATIVDKKMSKAARIVSALHN